MLFEKLSLPHLPVPSWARAQMLGPVDLRYDRLLLVGAHPDDIVLTMASLAFVGFSQVAAMVCTHGRPDFPRCASAVAEAILVRASRLYLGDAPDGEGPPDEKSVVSEMAAVIQDFAPTVIATHHRKDHHPAHRQVANMVTRAAQYQAFVHRPLVLHARPPANSNLTRFKPSVITAPNDLLAGLLARAIRLHPSECFKEFYKEEHKLNFMASQASYYLDPFGQLSDTPRFAECFELGAQ